MDMVEKLVSEDPADQRYLVCTEIFQPAGISHIPKRPFKRFANLKPAAPDFRIYWDNAYSVHHLYDDEKDQDFLLEILDGMRKSRKSGHGL